MCPHWPASLVTEDAESDFLFVSGSGDLCFLAVSAELLLGHRARTLILRHGVMMVGMAPDARHFELHTENRRVEGEKKDRVKGERPGGQETEVAKPFSWSRGRTRSQDANLDGIVPDDRPTFAIDGRLNNMGYRLTSAATAGARVLLSMEYGASESNGFFESDRQDQKRDPSGEEKHAYRHPVGGRECQSEEECKRVGDQDRGRQPEAGPRRRIALKRDSRVRLMAT